MFRERYVKSSWGGKAKYLREKLGWKGEEWGQGLCQRWLDRKGGP